MTPLTDKLIPLQRAAQLVEDGESISLSGSHMQRAPAAFARELARCGRTRLELIKPSPGYDADLLAATGCLDRIQSGIVLLEQPYGMAENFRRRVEAGEIRVREHSCISVIAGLRAAAFGIPFQPLAALEGSDIPSASGLLEIQDPRTGETVIAVEAIRPDLAVIHVPVADAFGNARILGTPFWDRVFVRAARWVVVTAEEIVDSAELAKQPELTSISGVFVDAVVHVPHGAAPTSCYPLYDADEAAMRSYLDAARTAEGLAAYLEATESRDRAEGVPVGVST